MSLWNRIGEVATNAGKFVGEVAGGVAGSAKFAWDVATAPFNDAEQYNGFVNTFKSAYDENQKAIAKPIASVGNAIMKTPIVAPALKELNTINQNVLREPAATVNLVQGDVNQSGNVLNYFNPAEWKKAYQGAQSISVGQAVNYVWNKSIFDKNFNIYDPAQREQAFKNSTWGKVTSGAIDAAAQLGLDVSLGAGRAIKAAKASTLGVGAIRTADDAAQAAEEITKAQIGGVKNRFTKPLEDFTKNDSLYALNHPMIKSSSNPGLLAHMLGESTDVNTTAEILRSALGDPQAMADLAVKRADLTQALDLAKSNLDAVDNYKLFAVPDGSGMLPFMSFDKGVLKEAKDNYDALIKNDKYLAKLMQVGQGSGSLTRTTGVGLQSAEDFVAKSRALKFYDKTVANPKVEVYQPTPFHKMYQKISWAADERPAGLVDFNDPDSYKEIVAELNRVTPGLTKVGAVSQEEANGLLNSYIGAATPEARNQAALTLENTLFKRIADKHGIDPDLAEEIYSGYKNARVSAMQAIKDQGFMVDSDKKILTVQQLESQSADFLPLMDFELMDKLLKRNAESLNMLGKTGKVVGQGKDTVLHYMDFLQDAFKAGALLRLGYTLRNGLDSQLRIAASVGAMASLSHLGEGMKDLVYNTYKTAGSMVDDLKVIPGEKINFKQVEKNRVNVLKEINAHDKKIAELEATVSLGGVDSIDAIGELGVEQTLRAEKQGIFEHYTDLIANRAEKSAKRYIGTGTLPIYTSDGKVYFLDDAFGGKLGEMFRAKTSSSASFQRMVDINTDLYSKNLASKGIGIIKPEDPQYFEQWAQTLNRQFGNSKVVKKIADGESVDDISKWLRSSPEGRDLRSRLGLSADDSAEYVTKINGFFDHYLPDTSGLRNKLGEITPNDLRKTFKDPADLPVIHGHVLRNNIDNLDHIQARKIINGLFKVLGTMPEDAWARHPLYIKLYRDEAKRRLNILSDAKQATVTPAEQQAIMAESHKIAQRGMKQILFNIERRSNLAAAFKYVSPFFSAQENAYKTWMKFAANNPAIVNKGYQVWEAPNKAGLVTDQDGKPVPEGKTTGNDNIWIQLPKGVSKLPGFIGRGLTSLDNMAIPKQSLDVLFQGGMDLAFNKGNQNAFGDLFPIGPYVAIPASEFVKRYEGKVPGIEDAFHWALPYGPSSATGSLDQFMPAWYKRAQTMSSGMDDKKYAQTFQLIWNTEQYNAKQEGKPPVSDKKIAEMTSAFYKMRIAANLILPFAPKFDSPYRFYMDQYRAFQKQYGLDADRKFLDPQTGYPDFFDFATSLSKNPTGIQSTENAVTNARKYSDLVGDIFNEIPSLVGFIVNDPKDSKFSPAAYTWLSTNKVSPSSPDTFKQAQSPIEARKKNEASRGWATYGQLTDYIDEQLKTRGLTSISQKGAEDLQAAKQAVIDNLAYVRDAQGNPVVDKTTGQNVKTAWYDDYLDTDGSKTNRVIAGLGKVFDNTKFMEDHKDDPTWKSVRLYLNLRQTLAAQLASRAVKSIDAKANQDIKTAYDVVVDNLKQDNGFKNMYDRLLSQDLVYEKYLTPKESK